MATDNESPSSHGSNLYLLSSIVVLFILASFLGLIAARAIIIHRRRRARELQFAMSPSAIIAAATRQQIRKSSKCPPKMHTVWLHPSPSGETQDYTTTTSGATGTVTEGAWHWQDISPLAAIYLNKDCSSDQDAVNKEVDAQAPSNTFSVPPRASVRALGVTTYLGTLARHLRPHPRQPPLLPSPSPPPPPPSSPPPEEVASLLLGDGDVSPGRIQVACLVRFPGRDDSNNVPHLELGVTVV